VATPSVAVGVSGGEDGVHEHERAHDLGDEPRALAEPVAQDVRTAAVPRELLWRVHGPDERHSADGAEALRGDVERGAGQRHLPRQEHCERHGRDDVPAWPHPRVAHT
jgi:hypothetical protein